MPDQRGGKAHQPLGQPAGGEQLAGEQEERDRQQQELGDAGDGGGDHGRRRHGAAERNREVGRPPARKALGQRRPDDQSRAAARPMTRLGERSLGTAMKEAAP